MSNIIKFPIMSADLVEIAEVLEQAHEAEAKLEQDLWALKDKIQDLQNLYNRELESFGHRLGGMKHVPLEYLMHASGELFEKHLEEAMEGLWNTTS